MVDGPLRSLRGWMLGNDRALAMFYEIPDVVDLPEHAHRAQWGVVLAGAIDFTIGDETRTYRTRDTYYVPAEMPHSAVIHPGYVGIDVFAVRPQFTPASPHFVPVRLDANFNVSRAHLPEALRPPAGDDFFGDRVVRGIPFAFGPKEGLNVILLDKATVTVELGDVTAHYIVIVHAASDVATVYLDGFADTDIDGCMLGGAVSEYALCFADGTIASVPIRRRFAIQQARVGWGSSAFAAVPALEDLVRRRVADQIVATGVSTSTFGQGEVRHESARDASFRDMYPGEMLWIYALPNPSPNTRLAALQFAPRGEKSAVYAMSLTSFHDHPLRPGVRRTFRARIPEGVVLDPLGELNAVAVDLGSVLSSRAALHYDDERWIAAEPICTPSDSESDALIEVAAHPGAQLHFGTGASSFVHELAKPANGIIEIARADRPVRLRIVDGETGTRVAARLHVHGEAGEYLPPRGHHRLVNTNWFEDLYAEFAVGRHQYAYTDGECILDLPLGTVYVEISRGYEIFPVRRAIEVDAETTELVFELDRVLRWRDRGWVTADTHVHFLSPQTALLEGCAEGVNVVNLLASQWGEMYSNVGDFDGSTTFGAKDFGGDGEFLVRVGSENRMQVLGHISLLGYTGGLIHPLCTGGPSESALGDQLEVTMAEWARRCLDQRGLVVMPHAPDPQLERAADIVLGVVDAIELMMFNPLAAPSGINPYGIADWYRYLNLGYQIPLVAGSDKMSAASLLGGIRTYANLGEREFTYEDWMRAIRAGDTFVTFGPLVSVEVDGIRPGGQVELPSRGGTVSVTWEVESVAVPIEKIEIVTGGLIAEDVTVGGALSARGSAQVPVDSSTWIALRVRGSYHGRPDDIAAHTSAVQVLVEGSSLFSELDGAAVLDQIQGAIAYVDTLAPHPEARRFRERRAILEAAYNHMHQRMHRAGIYHRHPPHDPAQPHEH
jgi:hypothetical protein